jgi:hypothetical protein
MRKGLQPGKYEMPVSSHDSSTNIAKQFGRVWSYLVIALTIEMTLVDHVLLCILDKSYSIDSFVRLRCKSRPNCAGGVSVASRHRHETVFATSNSTLAGPAAPVRGAVRRRSRRLGGDCELQFITDQLGTASDPADERQPTVMTQQGALGTRSCDVDRSSTRGGGQKPDLDRAPKRSSNSSPAAPRRG